MRLWQQRCHSADPRQSRLSAGVLACLDGYMNIAMEQTEEYVNGQLKAKYGDTFIRGNNGVHCRRNPPSMVLLPCWGGRCACSRAVLYISTQKKRA
jgi:hypothetical protein